MSTGTKTFNVGQMTNMERASVRQELTEYWDRTDDVVQKQIQETAIQGIDAVQRVLDLAASLAPLDDESPLGSIGFAIAQEIRKAVKGDF